MFTFDTPPPCLPSLFLWQLSTYRSGWGACIVFSFLVLGPHMVMLRTISWLCTQGTRCRVGDGTCAKPSTKSQYYLSSRPAVFTLRSPLWEASYLVVHWLAGLPKVWNLHRNIIEVKGMDMAHAHTHLPRSNSLINGHPLMGLNISSLSPCWTCTPYFGTHP